MCQATCSPLFFATAVHTRPRERIYVQPAHKIRGAAARHASRSWSLNATAVGRKSVPQCLRVRGLLQQHGRASSSSKDGGQLFGASRGNARKVRRQCRATVGRASPAGVGPLRVHVRVASRPFCRRTELTRMVLLLEVVVPPLLPVLHSSWTMAHPPLSLPFSDSTLPPVRSPVCCALSV